jgi:REP element-mobilizing transposase RayT
VARDVHSPGRYHPPMDLLRVFSKARRPWLKECCYHISHRCVRTAKALQFSHQRDSVMRRLREMSGKYPVKVLNFLVGTDGYRLLLAAPAPSALAAPISFLNGSTAQDYAARKGWEGSVWKGKYNVTLIQSPAQALRCSLDMDFAMLREQPEKLFHPLLWKHSGHLELSGVRKRYRIIDRKALRHWFMDVPWAEFRDWYILATNAKWNSREYAQEEWWEDALIVGEKSFCERVADSVPESRRSLCVYSALSTVPGLENQLAWTVSTSRSYKRAYILRSKP